MSVNNKTTFAEKVQGLKVNTDQFKEIVSLCSLATIRQICVNHNMAPSKRYGDDIDPEHVDKYSNLNIGMVVRLFSHLGTQTSVKKVNGYDASSLLADSCTSVTLGCNTYTLSRGQENQKTSFNNGVLGKLSVEESVSTVISVSSRHVDKKALAAKNKKLCFHVDNELAPSQALTSALASISEIKAITPGQLRSQADKVKQLNEVDKEALYSTINDSVPVVKIKGEDQKATEQKLVTYKLTSMDFRTPTLSYMRVEGEYPMVAKRYETYHMGMGYPALKRLGKNMWTGVACDTLNIDHVISLHEAGVPVGSAILVVSSDTNLISLLRSNFGSGLYGVGNGNGMVSKGVAKSYKFDYTYYPKPIGFNCSGNFDASARQCVDSIKKKLEVYSTGQPIFYMSPMMLYCKEIASAFGFKIQEDDGSRISQVMYKPIPQDQKYKTEAIHYEASTETNYPLVDPAQLSTNRLEIAKYYEENPNIVTRLLDINAKVYTSLSYKQISNFMLPAKIANLSYEGVVLFGGKIPERNVINLIGESISYMRETYKSIWYMSARSANTYKIRRVIKGASVEELIWDDTYSAMYSSEVREEKQVKSPDAASIPETKNPTVEERKVMTEGRTTVQIEPKEDFSTLWDE